MNINILANEYAEAIIDISYEEKKEELYFEQFYDIYRDLLNNEEFLDLLLSNVLENKDKHELIEKIYSGSIETYIIDFLKYIVDKDDYKLILKIIKSVLFGFVDKLNYIVVVITSPYKLDDSKKNEIKQIIKKQNPDSKNILMFEEINPNLIAGIQVEYKNKKFDNSIKTKLNMIKFENKGA